MQEESRSNPERSEATQKSLVAAARTLFVEKGYVATSTPQIVSAACVSRGALYHHYGNKQDLFEAVLFEEAKAVATAIEDEPASVDDPLSQLVAGARAYVRAMGDHGRSRLLLIDGPVVLGPARMREIDQTLGARTLFEGLRALAPDTSDEHLSALSDILSAAFDRAALAISQGSDKKQYTDALIVLLKAVSQMATADKM
jgi:AcrR family transcriptional regulator